MGCSQPNMIAVGHDGVQFLGPRMAEDDPEWFYIHRRFRNLHDVPCGKCDLCRVTRRYERALRIMLEAESFPDSTYFITLTYDDAHLGSPELDHSDWAQFMKDFRRHFTQAQYCPLTWKKDGRCYPRLRKKKPVVKSLTFKEIKQVVAGEYGDTFGRKHFHGILFGHEFSDLTPTGTFSSRGHAIHTSESLRRVWNKGFVQIERVNMDLALYVSSYITDQALEDRPDKDRIKKQYGRFGRGIGRSWMEKYYRDVLSAGVLMLRSGDYPIPRTFLRWFEEHPEFVKWKAEKALTVAERTVSNIRKEDGPLRRARAKGRIFKHIHKKKENDRGFIKP